MKATSGSVSLLMLLEHKLKCLVLLQELHILIEMGLSNLGISWTLENQHCIFHLISRLEEGSVCVEK